MIKTFYQEDIINRLASLITYGIEKGYSYKAIEEHISSSIFVNDLENNHYNIESKIEKIVEQAYGVLIDNSFDISFEGLFYAESYFKLFLYFNKSFEYIFLYWPLSDFSDRYGIYHEMDFSNLRNDFALRISKTTLLKKLAKERQIKLIEISKLTGISESTIDKYSRNDKYLYGASYDNIYKLSSLFEAKENMFASNLGVYLDQSIYLFDKNLVDYRNCLGLYFASFYDKRINEIDFEYDRNNNYFKSKEGKRLIVIADILENILVSELNKIVDEKTYVVIIPSGINNNRSCFEYLKEVNALDVLVLTQEYAYILKKNSVKEITETVNRSLIIRAKEKSISI